MITVIQRSRHKVKLLRRIREEKRQEGGTGAGGMRQGIRGTTINTRIERKDVNKENTNQTHVKQHAR